MEFIYSVSLILIFVVNILFFLSGTCLNSLVIVSFWRSVQLRKKLCHFTIMVLSCCDLLVALTNHPATALMAILWFTETFNAFPGWLVISDGLSNMLLGFSLLALFVMSFERYLSTHYPILHRTSVTKKKLLTLFSFVAIVQIIVAVMSLNDLVISYQVGLLIFCMIFITPMLFINCKLFTVARKSRKNNRILRGEKKSISLKNISSCLLIVASLIVLSIPTLVYIGLRLTSKKKANTLDNAQLTAVWAKTTASMNSTFNCLIVYWKNKTLRAEGMKIIKGMKIR